MVAGGKGASHRVSWIQQIEDPEQAEHLRGNELVITTGIAAHATHGFMEGLLATLADRHCSGLVVHTGKYLKEADLTDGIKAFCDDREFPIFTMPQKVPVFDFIQDCCNRIFEDTYLDKTVSKLFQNMIFHREMQDVLIPPLNAGGYAVDSAYCIILMRKLGSLLDVGHLFSRLKSRFQMFRNGDLHIVILSDADKDELPRIIAELESYIEERILKSPRIQRPTIGVSEIIHDLRELHYCYDQALYALRYAEYRKSGCQHFADLGIFRILYSIPDFDLLRRFTEESLEPLIDEDEDAELLSTLKSYLMHDGSLQRIAEDLYVHRNTVNYRMNKIRALLGSDLTSPDERFMLRLAFHIRDLMDFHPDKRGDA
jgi:hypothetical protein